MVAKTDPALELATLCEALRGFPDQVTGETVLAQQFGVQPHSAAFYQMLFIVIQRFEQLSMIVQKIDMDTSMKQEAVSHISTVSRAFGRDSLQNQWNYAKTHFLTPGAIGPIKFLSPVLRPTFNYASLNTDEIAVLLEDIDQVSKWLMDHQMVEQDFFRAAIIEGLGVLRFRLERLRWLGWGYSLVALRDVIQAYLALNGIIPDANLRPDAGSLLMKLSAFVVRVCKIANIAKEAAETGEFMINAYGAITSITSDNPGIAGLIGKANN